MKKIFKASILIVTCVIVVSVFGTSIFYGNQLESIVEDILIASYSEQVSLDYEIPSNELNIFVNQIGYEIGGDMTVIFRGSNIPETFEVIDYNTQEVVYVGEVLSKSTGLIADMRVGDFTELTQEGDYYVKADYIGHSYPFQIQNKVKENLFKSTYYATVDRMVLSNDLMEQVEVGNTVLVAYEFYPVNFTDNTGISESGNDIPDILDTMQSIIHTIEREIESGIKWTTAEEFTIIGFLAKYGRLYEPYNKTEGVRYRSLAQELWKDIEYDEEDLVNRYFAASELYCSTGSSQYHNVVKEYKEVIINQYDADSIYKLYGDLTYIRTKYTTDKSYCSTIMQERIDRALAIASQVNARGDGSLGGNTERSLYNSLELIVIIQVLISHEYRNMLQEQLTYFSGVNVDGINYLNEINADPFFLMIMCDIIT